MKAGKKQTAVEELTQLIDQAHSPYHCVEYCIEKLKGNGFEELSLAKPFQIVPGGKYYISVYGSTCIAFTIGKNLGENAGQSTEKNTGRDQKQEDELPQLRMITAHTDWPTFVLKPNPELLTKGYGRLNAEPYGGAVYASWLDRPLGIAGKVCIKGEDPFHPMARLFDSERAVATIPGLAIHMNREMNDGMKLNPQTHLLPIVMLQSKKEEMTEKAFFLQYLAEELQVKKEDILDYELFLYNIEESAFAGLHSEMLSAPRIDNYSSVQAALSALLSNKEQDTKICMSAFYHNEEIGSMTKQGADSSLTLSILERICRALDYEKEACSCMLAEGLCLSLDVAHALHPAYPEKSDLTNEITMGDGAAIKLAAKQSYATDSSYVSVVQALCEKHQIPYVKYVNRSDLRGGSTLGSISSAKLAMPTVDVGVPLLSMHSARELMAGADQEALSALAKVFFKEN